MTQLADRVAPSRRRRSALLSAAAALICALTAVALLLWGRSYPGFPYSVAALALLATLAALALALLSHPRSRRTIAALGGVAMVLGAGVVSDRLIGDNLLHERWSRSKEAFAAQVAVLPSPTPYSAEDDGAFRQFPAPCPRRLGEYQLSECWVIDGGYLFLQAPGALTDVSGIAYLPTGNPPAPSSLGSDGLTPLGGPWWSWTCYC